MAAFELLADYGLRLDGRKANELRVIKCRLGVFGQAGDNHDIWVKLFKIKSQNIISDDKTTT